MDSGIRGRSDNPRAVWREIWDTLGPQTDAVLFENRATWNEQVPLIMTRNGFPEETFFTFSYSPIPADDGGVGGVFCACSEDTRRVLGERRLKTLRDLGERTTSEARSAEDACRVAAAVLEQSAHDLPFVLLYLLDADGRRANLAGCAGMPRGTAASPETVTLGANEAWPLSTCIETRSRLVQDLPALFGPLPGGPWPESPTLAMVLPLAQAGSERPAGFVVGGISWARSPSAASTSTSCSAAGIRR